MLIYPDPKGGPGKSMYTFSITFRFPHIASRRAGEQKAEDVRWKTYTLIYPDPLKIKNKQMNKQNYENKNCSLEENCRICLLRFLLRFTRFFVLKQRL